MLAINESYSTGEPLLTYRTTNDRRYDMSYISLSLLAETHEYMEHTINSLTTLYKSLGNPMVTGTQIIDTQDYDFGKLDSSSDEVEAACGTYNYRHFMIVDRIICHPEHRV
jgi:hypothetical protein